MGWYWAIGLGAVGCVVGGPLGGVAAVCHALEIAAVSATTAGVIGAGAGAAAGACVEERSGPWYWVSSAESPVKGSWRRSR